MARGNDGWTHSDRLSIILVEIRQQSVGSDLYFLVILLGGELDDAGAIDEIGRVEVKIADTEWFQHND